MEHLPAGRHILDIEHAEPWHGDRLHAGKSSDVSRIFALYHGPHSLRDCKQDKKTGFPWENPDEYQDVSG